MTQTPSLAVEVIKSIILEVGIRALSTPTSGEASALSEQRSVAGAGPAPGSAAEGGAGAREGEYDARACEMLAYSYREQGLIESAEGIEEEGTHSPEERAAVRAISAALAPSPTEQRLREALEPFARALDEWGDEPEHPDSRDTWEHPIAMCITLGDFRRARQALERNQS